MVGIFNAGCKKDNKSSLTAAQAAANLSKDTLYYLFKDEYMFTDVIPAYDVVNPHSFANNDSLFAKLTRYSTTPKDHYSFIDKTGYVSSVIGGGVSQGDIGLSVTYNALNDMRVTEVSKGSPSYAQSVHRGWQVTAVNGNTNMTYDGSSVGGNSTNITRISNAIYNSSSVSLTFLKPDNTSVTKTLNAASYTIDPVTFDSVYTFGARKVGYMVLSYFIDLTNIQTELNSVFSSFVSQGVTDLVVDLRYNGGGSVATSEYMADLIAPSSVGIDSTKVMYTAVFNSIVQNQTYSTFTKTCKLPPPYQTYFYSDLFDAENTGDVIDYVKKGSLNIQNVVFLVTDGTASASELLINNLKPYMNVKLIGKTTYGKPYAFFPIPVGGYDMYAISFKTANSLNQGDYYNGLSVNVDMYEDLTKDWGKLDEAYLNQAFMTLGVKSLQLAKSQKAISAPLYSSKSVRGFKGMIEYRKKK